MKTFLILGASSNVGRFITDGIKHDCNSRGEEYKIIGTTSRNENIEHVHETITGIDYTNDEYQDKIIKQIQGRPIDCMVYTFAMGPTGFPCPYATKEEVETSIRYSVYPLLSLTKQLKPALAVGISGFVWIKPLLMSYGAMLYAKSLMEEIAIKHHDKFRILRLGFFESFSSRGIRVLVQRNMKSGKFPELNKWYKDCMEEVPHKNFKDFFSQVDYQHEEKEYKNKFDIPFRGTELNDIKDGFIRLLNTDKPIVNVLGSWIWDENYTYDWDKLSIINKEWIPKSIYTLVE